LERKATAQGALGVFGSVPLNLGGRFLAIGIEMPWRLGLTGSNVFGPPGGFVVNSAASNAAFEFSKLLGFKVALCHLEDIV
tara:strand:- start:172 stop:414 length:243 start_codon:yes stop_codon:yes gene_type:complete